MPVLGIGGLFFRSRDPDALTAWFLTKPEWDHPDVGRFARIHDPEGNAIELWEPPATS
jgi:hypothetical protein